MTPSQVIAKILGYLILIGAFGLKVPQIYNIIKSKSVAGERSRIRNN